jgi:DNA repair protein RecO (recombination protein O)
MKHMAPEAVYILNRRSYKESSLLLDVFSCEYGRQSVLAQGALKSKKGWAALLQVFQPLLITWSGRSTLKTLTTLEAPSSAIELHNERLYSAYYLNELILKLVSVSSDPYPNGLQPQRASSVHRALFLAYANALSGLQEQENIELPIRLFEFNLLEDLGIFPDCMHDIAGSKIEADLYYQIELQQGFKAVFPGDLQKTFKTPVILGCYLQYLQDNLTNLDELPLVAQQDCLRQLKKLMRCLIENALDGKEIKSRALFHRYQPKSLSSE